MNKPRNLEQEIMNAQINALGGCLFALAKVFLIGSALAWYSMTYLNSESKDSNSISQTPANISNYSSYKK